LLRKPNRLVSTSTSDQRDATSPPGAVAVFPKSIAEIGVPFPVKTTGMVILPV
jgi:hypothetical protein